MGLANGVTLQAQTAATPVSAVAPADTGKAVAPAYTEATLNLIETPQPPPAPPAPATSTPTTPPGPLDQWYEAWHGDGQGFNQIIWTGQQFLAVARFKVLSSPDGINWQIHRLSSSTMLWGVGTNGKIYIVVGDNGVLFTSTDLITWSPRPSGTTERLMEVMWHDGQFWAFGDNGTITNSPDGLTWTLAPKATGNFHYGIFADGKFVMANGQSVFISPDGKTWKAAIRTRGASLLNVAWSGKLFVAASGASVNMVSSKDGITWDGVNCGTSTGLSGVIWDGGQFIAVGGAEVLSSPDGSKWAVHSTGLSEIYLTAAEHNGTVLLTAKSGNIYVNKQPCKLAAPEIAFAPHAPGTQPLVMLTCASPGAKIYYTDDGSEPTTLSKLYTVPFAPAQAALLRTRSFEDGAITSDEASAQFAPGAANKAPGTSILTETWH